MTGIDLLTQRADDPRAQVLVDAAACILQDRNASYGEPEDNFQRIAWRWSSWLWCRGLLPPGVTVDPMDVAIMLSDVKDARICVTPTRQDHWTDRAGYSGCGYRCAVQAEDQDGPREGGLP